MTKRFIEELVAGSAIDEVFPVEHIDEERLEQARVLADHAGRRR